MDSHREGLGEGLGARRVQRDGYLEALKLRIGLVAILKISVVLGAVLSLVTDF